MDLNRRTGSMRKCHIRNGIICQRILASVAPGDGGCARGYGSVWLDIQADLNHRAGPMRKCHIRNAMIRERVLGSLATGEGSGRC